MADRISIYDVSNPLYFNWILLLIFAGSMCITIAFHTYRHWQQLTFSKKAPVLASVFVVKAALLFLDLITQSLLLYSVLVHFGVNLFGSANIVIPITLSIFVASPIITLVTNSLVNLPLHFTFISLRLRLSGHVEGFWRIFSSASHQALEHWFVLICGFGGLYIFSMTFWVLSVITSSEALDINTLVVGQYFDIGTTSVLTRIIQLNVVCNYGVGVISAILFWAFKFFSLIWTFAKAVIN